MRSKKREHSMSRLLTKQKCVHGVDGQVVKKVKMGKVPERGKTNALCLLFHNPVHGSHGWGLLNVQQVLMDRGLHQASEHHTS